MDPLSIALGALHAANLVGQCALKLNDLATRYSQASLIMSSISAECSTIQAQLYEVQRYTSEQPSHCEERFALQPQLLSALHTSLTSCVVTFSILDIEIKKTNPQTTMTFMNKMRFFRKDSTMKELLQQMRAQSTGITALLTAVQCNVSRDAIKIQQDNSELLNIITNRERADRAQYPEIDKRVAESVVTKDVAESIFSRSSTLGEVEFAFDDQIVNSQAYRRVLERFSARQSRSPPMAKESSPESNRQNDTLSPRHTEQISQLENVDAVTHLVSDGNRSNMSAVIIGISLGERMSRASWNWLSTPNDVNYITFQPSGQQFMFSDIAFNADGTVKAWGDQASTYENYLPGFPRLLLPPEHQRQHSSSLALNYLSKVTKNYDKTPIEMLQDYFRHLLEYACAEIDDALKGAFQSSPLYIVVSPPLGWEANEIQMKSVLKKALRAGGHVELIIVKESEAAAIGISEALDSEFSRNMATRQEFRNSWSFNRHTLGFAKPVVVVCNIGLNRTDVKAYTIVNREKLQLNEISSSTYYKCGMNILHHDFFDILDSKLPNGFLNKINAEDMEQLEDTWTSIVTKFTEKNSGWEYVILPSNTVDQLPPIRRFSRGNELRIPSDEFHAIFRSACSKIVENIQDVLKSHANSPKKAMFLTGPFMHCKYLRDMLKMTFTGTQLFYSHDDEARKTEITRGLISRGIWMEANRKSP